MRTWVIVVLVAITVVLILATACTKQPPPQRVSKLDVPTSQPSSQLELSVYDKTRVVKSTASFDLTNPPPLLIGYSGTPIPPYSNLCISVNYRVDIGAYEYIPPFEARKGGDFSLNGKVTSYDLYLFNLCVTGPNGTLKETVKKVSDGSSVPVACWLCDIDMDGDVDQTDFGLFQVQLEETYLWGDANRDGVVNASDASFVQNCIANDPYPNPPNPCCKADLNENMSISDKDLELVNQAIARLQ